MTEPLLEGPRVLLRPLRPADATERYLGWLHDPLVMRYLESRHQVHTLETVARFVAGHQGPRADPLFAICLRPAPGAGEPGRPRHIGNIKLGPIDLHNGVGTIGLLIGERDCWGRGYATEAIGLLCDHAFHTLGLRRLAAGAYAPNLGSIRAFERCGFAREGLLRGGALLLGRPVDVVLLGRLKGEPATLPAE